MSSAAPQTIETPLDARRLRGDFPILAREVRGRPLVYLDNAATTQKPARVIDALQHYYTHSNSNVHRGIHTLADEATQAYEATRDHVARFIGGVKREEVVFTRGTTEALNLVANHWMLHELGPEDKILLTEMEHHANLVPWLTVAKSTGAQLIYLPIDETYRLDMDKLTGLLDETVKIVAVSHMSNVLGTINPVSDIAQRAHEVGAQVVVDAAQSAPHLPLDVDALGADLVAFSAHKMLGPTGVGVLWGREELLGRMEPCQFGGEMIEWVTYEKATWADLPHKFEAGTPNIAGVAAFDAALDYLEEIGMEAIHEHEVEMITCALDRLRDLGGIRIFGPDTFEQRGSALSFEVEGIHPHDLSTFLDTRGVAVRAGHHCAQPLHRKMGVPASTRASFYLYNTTDDVDSLCSALQEAKEYFRI
ncbi:SufS family cysteine desulfurase [bacterium]|nr:SufS family cysteine desulfurase [bacterium]